MNLFQITGLGLIGGILTIVLNFAFIAGLFYFALWALQHFGII